MNAETSSTGRKGVPMRNLALTVMLSIMILGAAAVAWAFPQYGSPTTMVPNMVLDQNVDIWRATCLQCHDTEGHILSGNNCWSCHSPGQRESVHDVDDHVDTKWRCSACHRPAINDVTNLNCFDCHAQIRQNGDGDGDDDDDDRDGDDDWNRTRSRDGGFRR